MCFPNKKQKNNFTDQPTSTQKGDTVKPIKDQPSTTSATTNPTTQSPPTLPPVTTQPDMSTPKVAIIIYSMYGHIAKRSLGYSSHILFILILPFTVAEEEKAGVESAGGKADIYQYESLSFNQNELFLFCLLGH
jgi:NAD(P)H dehydrogenase (quinone)